jgi:rRNA maturation protein Nop10
VIEQRCKVCGGELYVEAPPFVDMSEQDILDWRTADGKIVIACKECGEVKK